MNHIHAYAADAANADLKPYSYDPGALAADQVEVDVLACGLCHSDISMIDNQWGMSRYPLVAGHEVIGRINSVGDNVKHLEIGQTVGIGWMAHSCMTCQPCVSGHQHHCKTSQGTITGRHGGFADKIRADALWAIPLPDKLEPERAGPLFCGGITVFSPFVTYGIKPTDKVAVIGIGGLGHLALQFAKAWGCEVTAFTSSLDKRDVLKKLGAHHVVNSRDNDAIKNIKGKFDFILSTVNVNLPWYIYLSTLAPEGRLVTVGVVAEPMPIPAFSLISGQKLVGGSDTGSPAMIATMLEFCGRHNIAPQVEMFDMKDINEAIARLKSGKARYRVVLKN